MNKLQIRESHLRRTIASCAALAALFGVFTPVSAWAESQWNHEANIRAASIDVATDIREGDMSKSLARMESCLDNEHSTEKEAEYCVALNLALSDAGNDLRQAGVPLGNQVPSRDSTQDSRDILDRAKIPSSQDAKVIAAIQRVERASYEVSVAPEVRAAGLSQRVATLEASRAALKAKLDNANRAAATVAAAPPPVNGDWSGTFSCGANLKSASTSSPFSISMSMHVADGHAESKFEKFGAVWDMSGTVDQTGHVTLSGSGYYVRNTNASWALSFAGSVNGDTLNATGAEQSFDGLTRYRECQLMLAHG